MNLDGSNPMALEQLVRDRLLPGEVLLALATVAASLLAALRRERLPCAADPGAGESPLPAPLRQVELYRLRYELCFTRGRLRADERSRSRLWIVAAPPAFSPTSPPRRIPWRSPGPDFPVSPDRLLGVIEGGGRAIASVDPETGRVALHEADLSRLHGLGRHGRAVFLWPLVLATLAFWLLARQMLSDHLSTRLAMPASDIRLSLLLATATFAGALAIVMAPLLAAMSALLRRIRRTQLRKKYEPALRDFLAAQPRTD
ncbi:MAG TPA: hypothetical protein VFH68_02170 [Polyangia bacterium]|nr:hypothetical protein [Polyangia bacterium]